MVCVYCGGSSNVINSRLQKRTNSTWRRRKCLMCGAIFTTIESSAYETTLMVRYTQSHNIPFKRDQLLISIYDACRHRATAVDDATALTKTILSKIENHQNTPGVIERDTLVALAAEVLRLFDLPAYTYYRAYHPLDR